MSGPVTLGSSPATAIDAPAARAPKTVQEAAQQFEALMIGEMLKQARGDEDGWLGSGGGDAGTATETGLAEEQFAQSLARSGGLGLGASIVSSLSQREK